MYIVQVHYRSIYVAISLLVQESLPLESEYFEYYIAGINNSTVVYQCLVVAPMSNIIAPWWHKPI